MGPPGPILVRPAVDSGAAYLYLDWGDGWRFRERFATELAEVDSRLGTDVAVGAMGVLAGLPRYDGNGVPNQGAVAVWNGVVPLFYDGFDAGDTGAWSSAVP